MDKTYGESEDDITSSRDPTETTEQVPVALKVATRRILNAMPRLMQQLPPEKIEAQDLCEHNSNSGQSLLESTATRTPVMTEDDANLSGLSHDSSDLILSD